MDDGDFYIIRIAFCVFIFEVEAVEAFNNFGLGINQDENTSKNSEKLVLINISNNSNQIQENLYESLFKFSKYK